jgi:hypothetical protein
MIKGDINFLYGHPIYIATIELQRRKHRKKRINKKWLKRYGYEECDLMPHGQIYAMGDGIFWMTKRTYQRFKKQITSSSELASALEKRKEIKID